MDASFAILSSLLSTLQTDRLCSDFVIFFFDDLKLFIVREIHSDLQFTADRLLIADLYRFVTIDL